MATTPTKKKSKSTHGTEAGGKKRTLGTEDTKAKKTKGKREHVSDEELIAVYLKCGKVGEKTAKELGVTPKAVTKRLPALSLMIRKAEEKLEAEREAEAEKQFVVPNQYAREVAKVQKAADRAARDTTRRNILTDFEDVFMDICMVLEDVKKNVETYQQKGKPLPPFLVDQVVKLAGSKVSMLATAHKIRMEHLNAAATESFMQATINIMEKYDPNVRFKLYNELATVGLESQIPVADTCEDT